MNPFARAVLATILLSFMTTKAFPLDIAVIIHPKNKINSISSRHLSRIFKQKKRFWEGRNKIYLIMQEAGSPEKNLFIEKALKMRPNELKKLWLTEIIKGEITSFPKTLGSNASIKRFVSQIPSAIAYIDADLVDNSIKVLSIDGKNPGDEGYFLSDR